MAMVEGGSDALSNASTDQNSNDASQGELDIPGMHLPLLLLSALKKKNLELDERISQLGEDDVVS